MKIAAVIAEYNPFHNGHFYQLDTIRKTFDADFVIIVMSGDFVQRGEPAIIDKYVRCRMALTCGADAVFELPVYFSLGSAEYFAQGAVSLLDKLGVVDMLHFGSECGDIRLLCDCADVIANESDKYRQTLHVHLKEGKSFPLARSEAIKAIFPSYKKETSDIFSSPNNILALEYIKALKQRKSLITPLTLNRKGADFHSDTFTNNTFASANAIRKSLSDAHSNPLSDLKKYIPNACLEVLNNNTLLFPNDFSQVLLYKLLQIADFGGGFSHFYDVGNEFSNIITSNVTKFSSFKAFAHLCKSKNFTYTRICRALMHILLDMTQENADLLKQHDYCQYARLLGFRTSDGKSELLNLLKKNAAIPIITAPAKGLRNFTDSALVSLKADIHAANLYEGIKAHKMTSVSLLNELTREIIKLPANS